MLTTKLYCSITLAQPLSAASTIEANISNIKDWMMKNKLKLNNYKS